MDNKQFPEMDEEGILPEAEPLSPAQDPFSFVPQDDPGLTAPAEEPLTESEGAPVGEFIVDTVPAAEPELAVEEATPVEEVIAEDSSAEPVILPVIDEDAATVEEIIAEDSSAEPVILPVIDEDAATVEEIIAEDSFAEPEFSPAEELPMSAFFTEPILDEEITPDEHAMAWHGMTHPDDPEPEFDMSILDDPVFLGEDPSAENMQTDDFLASEDDGEFEALFSARAEEEKVKKNKKKRPVRKGRPKRKKGDGLFGIPHLLSTCVWLAVILAIGVTLGQMVWICAADVLAFGKEDGQVTVTIYESDTMDDIISKLHEAGLIRYPGLFGFYADISGAEEEIAPGIYDLNTRFDYMALVNAMSPSSTREVVKDVLIPEGYTCRQIFALLEEYKVCTAQDLAAYAANGELGDYWFLEGVERGDAYCLEGYLFPDTYEFYKNSTPKEVLTKMLDNFNYRFTEEMRTQLDTLNGRISDMMRSDGRSEEYIAEHLFTVREVVIVASLIEKETASPSESFTIASVIYNRLFRWGSTPAFLNIDASIIYALDGRTDLTAEDMRVDSPYNTYVYTGLTPGPISNPGLASLEATLNPNSTNYYYYVLNPETKVHQFSTTLDEHEAWVEQFRGME